MAATSWMTSATNVYVSLSLTQSELMPTAVPVSSGGAVPSQLRSGYDASAAFVCPGMSISGMTVMYRAFAYATIAE